MTLIPFLLVLLSAVMHAGWNMLVREQRIGDAFLRISIVIAVIGLPPALAAEFFGTPIFAAIWPYALLGGIFLAIYYLGLTRAYGTGDFTLVYPAARGLPVLFVAVADFARGHPPTAFGWLGLILVAAGCLLLPHETWRAIRWADYRTSTTVWILVAAVATAGYSIVDSSAARLMPPGLATALQYNVIESSLALVAFWIILLAAREPISPGGRRASWRGPALAAFFLFGGYTWVLWAFQLSANASYVLAVRQISIVMGVVAGAYFFREPAARLRITAAFIVTAGVVSVALAR